MISSATVLHSTQRAVMTKYDTCLRYVYTAEPLSGRYQLVRFLDGDVDGGFYDLEHDFPCNTDSFIKQLSCNAEWECRSN